MSRTGGRIRPERVAEQIRIETASILQRDLEDPRIGLATCTRVEVSRDLRVAKVYVSVLADADEQKETLEALGRASGYVRRLLSQRLGLRVSPEVRFIFDPSVEFSIQLEEMLEASKPYSSPDDDQEPPTDE
jgi:ribosome-binding factor A